MALFCFVQLYCSSPSHSILPSLNVVIAVSQRYLQKESRFIVLGKYKKQDFNCYIASGPSCTASLLSKAVRCQKTQIGVQVVPQILTCPRMGCHFCCSELSPDQVGEVCCVWLRKMWQPGLVDTARQPSSSVEDQKHKSRRKETIFSKNARGYFVRSKKRTKSHIACHRPRRTCSVPRHRGSSSCIPLGEKSDPVAIDLYASKGQENS